jgi:hypothetical protein
LAGDGQARTFALMVDEGPAPEGATASSVPPSVLAAAQSRARPRSKPRDRARSTAPVDPSNDPAALGAELAATRALVRAETDAEVGLAVSTLIHDLGGAVIPARYADPDTVIPVDVSLGLWEPLLPFADPVSVASMRLHAVLPGFLETARVALCRLQRLMQQEDGGTGEGTATETEAGHRKTGPPSDGPARGDQA